MSSRGHQRERAVAKIGRELGYLVSSLRHVGGPADQLWLPPWGITAPPLLIEVKGTTDPPWRSTWGPEDRAAMLAAEDLYGVEPMLAWWPPGLRGGPIWLPRSDWP